MNTMLAYVNRLVAVADDRKTRVFDWCKAVAIIKERGIRNASAGLKNDLEWTGGRILRNGVPVNRDDTYTYLASVWAEPVLIDDDEDDEIPCWMFQEESEYTSETYWPEDALALLNGHFD